MGGKPPSYEPLGREALVPPVMLNAEVVAGTPGWCMIREKVHWRVGEQLACRMHFKKVVVQGTLSEQFSAFGPLCERCSAVRAAP